MFLVNGSRLVGLVLVNTGRVFAGEPVNSVHHHTALRSDIRDCVYTGLIWMLDSMEKPR